MRIGIDAHILSPEHHRHHPEIAEYTRKLLHALLDRDQQNTYVLFMDSRMPETDREEFVQPNTEIKHFPFAYYRSYLPFLYSHMLVSSILQASALDVFHSPEGLIPYMYRGKTVATFHWVPTGKRDSNVFVKTWMLGARTGFKVFCRKADRIILRNGKDRDILCEIHQYPGDRAIVLHCEDVNAVDWEKQAEDMLTLYQELAAEQPRRKLLRLPKIPKIRRAKPKTAT